MKNNDDILTTDTTEIKQLINRVKQGELDQGDAQLIEKLLNIRALSASCLDFYYNPVKTARRKPADHGEKKRKRLLDKKFGAPSYQFRPRDPRGYSVHL